MRSQKLRTSKRAITGFIPDLTIIIDNILYTEQWKEIKGYNGVYQISNFGRVKSFFAPVNNIHGKIIKPSYTQKGYQYIGLSKNKVCKNYYIHRLVAIHFIPNPKNKPEVNHIGKDKDGKISKQDNKYISLEWVTKSENELHKNMCGMGVRGERHPYSILTEDNVYYIRGSNEPAKILSEKFNVSTTTIYYIRKFKIWKHLPKK